MGEEPEQSQMRDLPERITYRIRQFMFSAVAIIAGIAWADLFSAMYKKTLKNVHGNIEDNLVLMALYAVILTSMGVLITVLIAVFSAWVTSAKQKWHKKREKHNK